MKPGVKTFQSLRSFILITSSQRLLRDFYNLTRLSSITILKSVDFMYFLGVIPLEKIGKACRAVGIEPLKEHSLRKSCRARAFRYFAVCKQKWQRKTKHKTATGWLRPLNRGGHLMQVTNTAFVWAKNWDFENWPLFTGWPLNTG